MKKLVSMTVAAAMVLTFAACSKAPDSETSVPTTEAFTEDTTESTTESTAESATEPATTAPDDTSRDITLIDNAHVTVKITGIAEDDIWGYTLKVYLDNKTDKELMFTVDKVSVNGFMCDPFWAATVDAGMKANEDISFSSSDFEKNGIETVESITLTLRAYDNDDWTSDDIVNETITINP